ncbi:MAG: hypothetical protein JNG83_00130 [Opitutaceae bacterium]|nr:hypothetical protein [Opitutaceae bacterium]
MTDSGGMLGEYLRLALALGCLGGSAAAYRGPPPTRQPVSARAQPPATAAVAELEGAGEGTTWLDEVWLPPPGSGEGSADLFAPFRSQAPAAGGESPASEFPFALMRVEPLPFRVQLAGLYRDRLGVVAVLTDASAAGLRRARVTERLEDLEVQVEEVVEAGGPGAYAILRDERTGRRIRLIAGRTEFTEQKIAWCCWREQPEAWFVWQEGERRVHDGRGYELVRLELDPQEMRICTAAGERSVPASPWPEE